MLRQCAVAVSVMIVAACAATSSDTDHGADSLAIQELNARWYAAENAKSVDSLMQLFAPEFVLHLAGLPPVQGDSAVRALYAGFFQSLQHIEGESERLVISLSGDQAYEVGTSRMTLTGADGKEQRDIGKYLIVWRKTAGTWKAVAASSTSNGPLK